MNAINTRIDELIEYRPQRTATDDFDSFWEAQLQKHANKKFASTKEKFATNMQANVYKVSYEGFEDTFIHGWYLTPLTHTQPKEKFPAVVCFHGYSGNKGYPEQYAHWILQGYAVLAIDIRGQNGETGNLLPQHHGSAKGWVGQGILTPEKSYFLACIVDCLRAVEWIAQQPEVDDQKILLYGSSQGGGLALCVTALSSLPCAVAASIPNMCHMDYGILHSTSSLSELALFLKVQPHHYDTVLRTLSYFDVMNLAKRIHIPVLMSVGLQDTVCMPETIYAAYNRLETKKEIKVYPFMGHEYSAAHDQIIFKWAKTVVKCRD